MARRSRKRTQSYPAFLICGQLLPAKAGSLSLALRYKRIRDVWLADSSPTGDIARRDVVCKPRVPADHTTKGLLRKTVPLIGMSTNRTGA